MSTTETETRVKITEFVKNMSRSKNIESDSEIFLDGVVNSLFATQLVVYLEDELNVEILNDDLKMENFSTIDSLVRFVGDKTGTW